MTRPKVSVVIPVYNCAEYIAQTLRSVTEQTERDLEVVVMDDGSTDGTYDVLQKMAARDARIKVHTQKNSGLPAIARNAALARATGEYICFLDGDDLYHPEKIERQLAVIQAHPEVSIVFHEVKLFQNEPDEEPGEFYAGRVQFRERAKKWLTPIGADAYLCREDFYRFMSVEINVVHTSAILFRRQLLREEKVWFPELELGEDTDLWFRLARTGRMAYIDRPLSFYRQRPGSMSRLQERITRTMVIVMSANLKRGWNEFSRSERRILKKKLAADYFNLGYLCKSKGKKREARGAYLKSFALRPGWKPLKALAGAILPGGGK